MKEIKDGKPPESSLGVEESKGSEAPLITQVAIAALANTTSPSPECFAGAGVGVGAGEGRAPSPPGAVRVTIGDVTNPEEQIDRGDEHNGHIKDRSDLAARLKCFLAEQAGTQQDALTDRTVFQKPTDNKAFFINRPMQMDAIRAAFAAEGNAHLALTTDGLGGLGKTQLAVDYFLRPQRPADQPYTLRAWFYAKTGPELQRQYIQLGEEQSLSLSDDLPMKERAKRVRDWLSAQTHILLVYDDAPDQATLNEWLPENEGHHILVTSRHTSDPWFGADGHLEVGVMEVDQAIALVRKMTNSQESKEALTQLVKTLECLPLAMAQAAAFMQQRKMGSVDYLIRYKRVQRNHLPQPHSPQNIEYEPIRLAFELNVEAIKLTSPQAMSVLNHAAWLGTYHLPEFLLFSLLPEGEHTLAWLDIKKTLSRYSLLIMGTRSGIHMHALLQNIVRDRQGEEGLTFLQATCDRLDELYNLSNDEQSSTAYHDLLPHAECLHAHAKASAEGANTFPLLSIKPTCLGDIYQTLGLYSIAQAYWQYSLAVTKAVYGSESREVLVIANNLAKTKPLTLNIKGGTPCAQHSSNFFAGFFGYFASIAATAIIDSLVLAHDAAVGSILIGLGVGAFTIGAILPCVFSLLYGIFKICTTRDKPAAQAEAAAEHSKFSDDCYDTFIGLREWGGQSFLKGIYRNEYSKTYTHLKYSGTLIGVFSSAMILFMDMSLVLFFMPFYSAVMAANRPDCPYFSDKFSFIVSNSSSWMLRSYLLSEEETNKVRPEITLFEATTEEDRETNARRAGQEAAARTAASAAGRGSGQSVDASAGQYTPSYKQIRKAVNELPEEQRRHVRMG